MRDLRARLFASYYPSAVRRSDHAGQARTRQRLLAQAAGATLEIGAGSGANLPWYPDTVTALVLSDPSPYMLEHLRAAVAAVPRSPGAPVPSVTRAGFPRLPFADATFDTVVMTYVLCSVADPARALTEIARVLAPGGRLLFLEHVRAPAGSTLGRVQALTAGAHRLLADGCRPDRRTEAVLRASPLSVAWLERGEQASAAPTVRPTVMGVAVR
jgi:ubiquinone/menaquinone biosynthesis C-methylase UbiE